jgi:hypothetical protein
MTHDFDDLVEDLDQDERDRLRRVHDLLLAADPPPELTPKLERPAEPPTADIAFFPKRRHAAAAVAAAAIFVAAFGGGDLIGHAGGGDEFEATEVVTLNPTARAPENARASIQIGRKDEAGNWEMLVTVGGLEKIQRRAYYRLWLQRGNRVSLPCGDFVVAGTDDRAEVRFTVSYDVKPGDKWIVAYQAPRKHDEPGPILLTASV